MMRLTLTAIAMMSLLATNAVDAADCDTEIANVEAAINSATNLTSEELELVEQLLQLAKEECAPDTEERGSPGLSLLAEAKVILGIADAN